MRKFLYHYECVDRPFEDVLFLFQEHPSRIFQPATDSAVEEMGKVAVHLAVSSGHVEIGKDVVVELGEIHRDGWGARIPIRWKAASHAALFPSMEAEIELTPLSTPPHPVTQVSFIGNYRPPLRIIGLVGDAVVGHRLAEASVHRFLSELVQRVEAELPLVTVKTG